MSTIDKYGHAVQSRLLRADRSQSEFPVHNNSVHSNVAVTEPKHARRVVVSRAMKSSPEALDTNASPTCTHLSNNSLSSSQASTSEPVLRSSENSVASNTVQPTFSGLYILSSTHCMFYHGRPHLSSDRCIGLEQFAGVSPIITVVTSFSQQAENQTFCPVLQTWVWTSY